MRKYNLIGYEKGNTTCEHCGRGIKNIALLRNNITGEVESVGLTCVEKILKLNPQFAKALNKEIKKYYEYMEYYKDGLDIKINFNRLIKYDDYKDLSKRKILDKAISEKSFCLVRMIEHTRKLQKVSQSGLVQIENLKELEKQLSDFKNRFKTRPTGRSWEYILDNEQELLELTK